MGLELPGPLQDVLGLIGLDWPSTDESALMGQAQDWYALCVQTAAQDDNAIEAVAQLISTNTGLGIDAFLQAWQQVAGEHAVLSAQHLMGLSQADAGLLASIAVLQCKVAEIDYLVAAVVIMEIAVDAAPVTYGTSLVAAAEQLGTLTVLAKGSVQLCVMVIRALSLSQGAMVPALQGLTQRIGSRAIHHGAEATASDAGSISERLAHAEILAKTNKGRRGPKFRLTGGPPNGIVKRVNPQTGEIIGYAVYDADGIIKLRVDLLPTSATHRDEETGVDVPAPHVHEYVPDRAPDGSGASARIVRTRPCNPEDIP